MLDPKKKQILIKRQEPLECPHCQTKLTAMSGERRPQNGDINVCYYCLKMCIIEVADGDIRLRLPWSKAEEEAIEEAAAELAEGASRARPS